MSKSIFRRCLNRACGLFARYTPGATTVRPWLHRMRGVKIGRDAFIGDDVYFDAEYPESIEIQDGVQISIRALIVAHTRGPGRVVIEKNAFIGPHAIVACTAGRVIRTTSDQGVVYLLDDRFNRREVRRLLPTWWRVEACRLNTLQKTEA